MISSERLNGVQAFVMAVEAGSFTLAAVRLGLSRSAVGKGVARLEERLGVRLFQRTTRTLTLTEEGRAFHEGCVRALAELEAAEASVVSDIQRPSGRVRLAAPLLFGVHWLTPLVLDLAERHPDLEVEAVFSNSRVDLVEEGFDLAVRIGPLEDTVSLSARPLGLQQTVLCAAPHYLDAHSRPATIDELAVHPCITAPGDGQRVTWRLWTERGEARKVAVSGRVRLNSMEAVRQAAIRGAGVAQLPLWLAGGDISNGRLEVLLPGCCGPGAPITILWPSARRLPARARVVVDALVERFGKQQPWD